MRPGDYTLDGGIVKVYTDAVNPIGEQLFLFDSTAQAAAAASDFMIVHVVRANSNASIRFDFQGDAGSGALNIPGVVNSYAHETTAKEVVWYMRAAKPLILPSSLVGSADSTRTGIFQADASATTLVFQFCSWNGSSVP